MKKRTSKKINKISLYKSTLKVLGRIYEATGSSISESISNLKPQNCKGRGILTVEKDGIKKDRILTNVLTFRLFNSQGLTREIAIKNASLLFQGL